MKTASRRTRALYALVAVVLLTVIVNNLYRRHLRAVFARAVYGGDLQATRALLARGMDPNARYRNDNPAAYIAYEQGEEATPLALAAMTKNADMVNLLLTHGAKADSDALYYAAVLHCHDIAMILVAAGADPNAKPSFLAWKTLNIDMPLPIAAAQEDVPLVQALLAKGANPDVKDRMSQAALIIACEKQNRKMAETLLAGGANPNCTDGDGRTPMMTALGAGQPRHELEFVHMLLAHGADVNARGWSGSSALMTAASLAQADAVRLLLAHGADVYARDSRGWTALKLAQNASEAARQPEEKRKREAIVRLLTAAGARE